MKQLVQQQSSLVLIFTLTYQPHKSMLFSIRYHAEFIQRFDIYEWHWLTRAIYSTGKKVTHLEYQAYSKLAIKTMADIAENVIKSTTRSQHQPSTDINRVPSLIRCAIHHRLGTVVVGEPSIGKVNPPPLLHCANHPRDIAVIAVSSPHRKEAFAASEEILEQVKQRAQIWKREYYEDEDENDAEWKENTWMRFYILRICGMLALIKAIDDKFRYRASGNMCEAVNHAF